MAEKEKELARSITISPPIVNLQESQLLPPIFPSTTQFITPEVAPIELRPKESLSQTREAQSKLHESHRKSFQFPLDEIEPTKKTHEPTQTTHTFTIPSDLDQLQQENKELKLQLAIATNQAVILRKNYMLKLEHTQDMVRTLVQNFQALNSEAAAKAVHRTQLSITAKSQGFRGNTQPVEVTAICGLQDRSRSPPPLSVLPPDSKGVPIDSDRPGIHCTGVWLESEHSQYLHALLKYGARSSRHIATEVQSRNARQVRSHHQKWMLKFDIGLKATRARHNNFPDSLPLPGTPEQAVEYICSIAGEGSMIFRCLHDSESPSRNQLMLKLVKSVGHDGIATLVTYWETLLEIGENPCFCRLLCAITLADGSDPSFYFSAIDSMGLTTPKMVEKYMQKYPGIAQILQ
eukprot:gnl/Dysnectes_brevis/4961_a6922_810.p1 GENE.gnl/Dysnectes_brevis/4961_a6922_810~~gnl/Dysnectes_brevis/4961_a6922_810.p1  ORF type:complete len:405 (+),score=-38.69 gnl/Dysnectes_brevis/4961_a6922_810:38-1252(+)